jgi:hypothetical protein
MAASLSEIEIVTISRCIERILTVLIYGCSLGFGWNLFRVGIVTEQQGELSSGNWKITLKKVGPGVFFALFGVIGLITSVSSPLRVGSPVSENSRPSAKVEGFSYEASGLNQRDVDEIRAINTLLSQLERHPPASTPPEQEAAQKAAKILEDRKDRILSQTFPSYERYQQIKASLREHPDAVDRLSPQERDEYYQINGIATGDLSSGARR